MSSNFTLQASVSQDALTKVTRLFNASLNDILAELLQNARRSGATEVEIKKLKHDELGHVIKFSDNGPGLPSPNTLFTLGGSQWNAETCANEDAAGMGFFSLSGRTVRIIAQTVGTNQSWILDATPDAFTGQKPIVGQTGPQNHQGVTILFSSPELEHFASAAKNAAKYCPLKVTIQDEEAPRCDFLQDAEHIEEWKGIRIGIYRRPSTFSHRSANTNFHGVTLQIPLPYQAQIYHEDYHVRIDVITCQDLKLVLPARKEVVQDEFYQSLIAKIRTIYFGLVAQQKYHSLSFKAFCAAKTLGFDLPEATARLHPFSATHADRDCTEYKQAEQITSNAILYAGDDNPVDNQNLAWAFDDDADGWKLYDQKSAFEGYDWYERLARMQVTGYKLDFANSSISCKIGEVPQSEQRPKAITILGEIHSGGDGTSWGMPTDMLVLASEDAHIDEAVLHVKVTSTVTPSDLIDHITRALFRPCDDVESNSYDTQLQWFTDEAEDMILTYLESHDDMQRNQVLRTIKRELYWIMRNGSRIDIQIRDREVTVHGLDTVFNAVTSQESESLEGRG